MNAQQQEKEFIELVEEYKQVIYKVCYIYATDPDNLNDLYQEVVINLWKAFPRFRGECKASTWVYRIGLNTCISFSANPSHDRKWYLSRSIWKRWQRKKIKRLNFMNSTG